MTIYSLDVLLSQFGPVSCSMSSSNCCFLICIRISQEAGQGVWYSHLFKNLPSFAVIHTVKGFGIVNKAELRCFSGTLLLFDSSAFSKSSLNIWKFTVHLSATAQVYKHDTSGSLHVSLSCDSSFTSSLSMPLTCG